LRNEPDRRPTSRDAASALPSALLGTNSGPGNAVRIRGFEQWTIGEDGLIAKSLGHYDQAEYDRQLAQGVDG